MKKHRSTLYETPFTRGQECDQCKEEILGSWVGQITGYYPNTNTYDLCLNCVLKAIGLYKGELDEETKRS